MADSSPRSSPKLLGDVLNALLLLGDLLILASCLQLAYTVRFLSPLREVGRVDAAGPPDYGWIFMVGAVLFVALLVRFRLYQFQNLLRYRGMMRAVALGSVYWLAAVLILGTVIKLQPSLSRIYLVAACIACFSGMAVWRALVARLLHHPKIAPRLRQRFLFVGWSEDAGRLAQAIEKDRSHPYELLGCVVPASGKFGEEPPTGVKILGSYNSLKEHLGNGEVVVMAETDPGVAEILTLSDLCEQEMVEFKVIPSFFRILLSGLHLHTISGVPILGLDRLPLDQAFNRILKRGLDLAGAVAGLGLAAPLIVLFALLVKRESPGPVFYGQVRMGRKGRPFTMWKIRSMRLDAEDDGKARWAVEGDARCLRVGTFMRKWNIDELPQFWNVLKGEMSLVGPRPERPELIGEFKKKIPHYNARHWAKPGMTGWAQIHGLRGQCDLAERLRFDLYYMENWSPALDAYIMFMTLVRYRNAY